MLRFVYIFVISSFLLPLNVQADDFWSLKNINATKQGIKNISQTVHRCSVGLNGYFKNKPEHLVIITYGDRDSFVKGLVSELGFSVQTAEYFRKSSAPRPINGKMLVPPDQLLENVCHEVVHYYLESTTNRDNLLKAKWFDEGTASYLAAIIVKPESIDEIIKYFKKTYGNNFIPLSKIETEHDWHQLHQNMESRNKAYLQAMTQMKYFFDNYSVSQFNEILSLMNTSTFNQAFKMITGLSSKKFYRNWIKWMSKTENI
ncbi:MAG: hypothetical protein HYT75_00915 [Deltaproteobacteria bacterium]|nr:hypothetical protein [Deltaproteobacteria bacterium]